VAFVTEPKETIFFGMYSAFQAEGKAGNFTVSQRGQKILYKGIGKLFDFDNFGAVGADHEFEVLVVTRQFRVFDANRNLDSVDIHLFPVRVADVETHRELVFV
jgi:hypothetical protein